MLFIVFAFFLNSEYKDVATIITAQSVLESGWYKNDAHLVRNNYFSLKTRRHCKEPIQCLRKFDSVEDGLKAQLVYYRRHNYSVTRVQFLKDLVKKGYAEDPNYIKKVLRVEKSVNKRLNKCSDL